MFGLTLEGAEEEGVEERDPPAKLCASRRCSCGCRCVTKPTCYGESFHCYVPAGEFRFLLIIHLEPLVTRVRLGWMGQCYFGLRDDPYRTCTKLDAFLDWET